MMQEKAGFSERTVNKFIELILSQLVDADRLQVRIKARFRQLARGEIDGLTIQMSNYRLQQALRVETFNFDIGPAAINLQSVRRRKIELLRPSQGMLKLVITDDQLTQLLNAVFHDQREMAQETPSMQLIHCELQATGAIALCFQWLEGATVALGTDHVIPTIAEETHAVVLAPQAMEGQQPPDIWRQTAIGALTNCLSLNDIANQGTTFQVQQILVEAGKLTIQAIAHIEQFPTTA